MEFLDFQVWIRDGLVRDRLLATLAGFFGVVAVLLATVGLYGLIAFTVAARRQEIGLRAALGAHPRRIVALVMGDAGRLMGVGLLAGIVLALLVGRNATALLFGLTPYDPAILSAACLLLTGIAGAASFIPARRASRLDPLTALRDE
jgi:ABC-type antimicrobial peptide transport system permease subunit